MSVAPVWACLADWMVADGEPELPSRGEVLRMIGLRLRSEGTERWVTAAGAPVDVRSSVSGLVKAVIGAAGERFVEIVVLTPGFSVLHTLECPPVLPTRGDQIVLRGVLHMVGSYEWESFAWPDLRRDWRVLDVVPGRQERGLNSVPHRHDWFLRLELLPPPRRA